MSARSEIDLPRSAAGASASEGHTARLVRDYFAAYRSKDRKFFETHLAEDFAFTSPYDDAIGKTAYFERCWPNSEQLTGHEIERIFERGDAAFVTYRCGTRDGKEFRNTEFFVFDGDKLKQVHVYFGESYRDGAFVPQRP